jgi:glycerate dehydrogenase
MRIVLLDSFTTDQGEPDRFWQGFQRLGEVAIYPRTAPGEVVARARGAAAIVINKVNVDAGTFAALPELRYVGILATGVNVVDLAAARAANVAVTNVPGYSSESVAQLVFALVLTFTHDVAGHAAAVKAGEWSAAPDYCFFRQPLTELSGKTLVVVGSGGIGNAVARIGEAFGMRVLRAAVPGSPTTVGRTPLPECLAAGDVVSLHCPLTDATRGLVDERFLSMMKPDAILVNTGRGQLVNEGALVATLAAGRLRGVGLDVLSAEPPPADHPLVSPRAPWAKRLVVTPHIAWGTVEARQRLVAAAVDNLAAFLAGQSKNRVA